MAQKGSGDAGPAPAKCIQCLVTDPYVSKEAAEQAAKKFDGVLMAVECPAGAGWHLRLAHVPED
jgi:hypothetical protein